VKTLKWTNKNFNREKDKFRAHFREPFPRKRKPLLSEKNKKVVHLIRIFILQIIDPKHANYLFQDKDCAKKEHAIFRTR